MAGSLTKVKLEKKNMANPLSLAVNHIRAGTPVVLVGPPGVGKSDVAEQLALALGLKPVPVNAAHLSDAEWGGYRVPGKDAELRVQYDPWVSDVCSVPSLLVVDEATRWSSPAARNAALTPLQSRRFSDGRKMHGETRVLLLANPSSTDGDAQDLPAALANRLAHVAWAPSQDDWNNYMGGGPGALLGVPGLDTSKLPARVFPPGYERWAPMVVSFLSRNPASFSPDPPADPIKAGGPWPSPRAWSNTVASLSASDSLTFNEPDAYDFRLALVASLVGEGVAVQFMAWLREQDLPDPDAVLADPEKASLPKRADQAIIIARALGPAIRGDGKRAVAAVTYLGRLTNAGWGEVSGLAVTEGGAQIVGPIYKAGLARDPKVASLLKSAGLLGTATFLGLGG
jgi:hypothetical protein